MALGVVLLLRGETDRTLFQEIMGGWLVVVMIQVVVEREVGVSAEALRSPEAMG